MRRRTSTENRARALHRIALATTVLALVMILAPTMITLDTHAAGFSPGVARGVPDTSPTPRPQRPQINPVTAGDNVVVPGAEAAGDVSGLPTSGAGVTGSVDSLRRWTGLAVVLLAANAVILFAAAARSWRKREI